MKKYVKIKVDSANYLSLNKTTDINNLAIVIFVKFYELFNSRISNAIYDRTNYLIKK